MRNSTRQLSKLVGYCPMTGRYPNHCISSLDIELCTKGDDTWPLTKLWACYSGVRVQQHSANGGSPSVTLFYNLRCCIRILGELQMGHHTMELRYHYTQRPIKQDCICATKFYNSQIDQKISLYHLTVPCSHHSILHQGDFLNRHKCTCFIYYTRLSAEASRYHITD